MYNIIDQFLSLEEVFYKYDTVQTHNLLLESL